MDTELFEIISYLKSHNDYISSKLLSQTLGISNRAINYTIRMYHDFLYDHGINIVSKSRLGYKYTEVDARKANKFYLMRDIISYDHEQTLKEILVDILLKNLKSGNLSEIADQYFVSDSTAYRIFNELARSLEVYDLVLDTDENERYQISGSYMDKRRCLTHNYFSKLNIINSKDLETFESERKKILVTAFTILKAYDVQIREEAISQLAIHLFVSKQVGENLEKLGIEAQEPQAHASDEVAKALVIAICSNEKAAYLSQEIEFIASYITGVQVSSSLSEEDTIIYDIITKVNQRIFDVMGFRMDKDEQFLEHLRAHLKPMVHRVRHKIPLDNPMLYSIKRTIEPGLDCALIAATCLEDTFGLVLNSSEISYLSLHFATNFFKKEQHKKRVILVSDQGFGLTNYFKQRISDQLEINENSIDVFSSFQILDAILTPEDLIISTSEIQTLVRQDVIYIDNLDFDFSPYKLSLAKRDIFKDAQKQIITHLNIDFEEKKEISELIKNEAKLPKNIRNEIIEALDSELRKDFLSKNNEIIVPTVMSKQVKETQILIIGLKKSIKTQTNIIKMLVIPIYEWGNVKKRQQLTLALDQIISSETKSTILKNANAKEEILMLFEEYNHN